jgi:hypothetical protein
MRASSIIELCWAKVRVPSTTYEGNSKGDDGGHNKNDDAGDDNAWQSKGACAFHHLEREGEGACTRKKPEQTKPEIRNQKSEIRNHAKKRRLKTKLTVASAWYAGLKAC